MPFGQRQSVVSMCPSGAGQSCCGFKGVAQWSGRGLRRTGRGDKKKEISLMRSLAVKEKREGVDKFCEFT